MRDHNTKTQNAKKSAAEATLDSLLLLIERALVTIRTKVDAGKPGRSLPHDFANLLQGSFLRALNDQLIVNMADDGILGKALHCMGKHISGDGLRNVLDDFRAIRFNPTPLFAGIVAHVGDGLSAILIPFDPGFHIGQLPAGGELDEKHSCVLSIRIPQKGDGDADIFLDHLSFNVRRLSCS